MLAPNRPTATVSRRRSSAHVTGDRFAVTPGLEAGPEVGQPRRSRDDDALETVFGRMRALNRDVENAVVEALRNERAVIHPMP